MEHGGISLDFGKKFFQDKLLGALQKQSSSSVAWGMVHLIKHAQVISYLIACSLLALVITYSVLVTYIFCVKGQKRLFLDLHCRSL